jgi:hypothetical protein
MNHIQPANFDSKYAYLAACASAEVIDSLSNVVNGHDEKGVVTGIATELGCCHRTLQASMVRTLLAGLVKWAEDADAHSATDGRNEAAVKAILKLAPVIKDTAIPFI